MYAESLKLASLGQTDSQWLMDHDVHAVCDAMSDFRIFQVGISDMREKAKMTFTITVHQRPHRQRQLHSGLRRCRCRYPVLCGAVLCILRFKPIVMLIPEDARTMARLLLPPIAWRSA